MRGGTSCAKLCVVVVLYLSVGVFACVGKCRSYGALNFVVFCFPRVSYRALPSFHPGLCRSAALAGLISPFICVSPGFHIGLCPHFTLGYAGVPPLQGSSSDWAFAVLFRGIVFVKCVCVCKWFVAFVCVFETV